MEASNTREAKIEHNKALARKWILEAWNQNRFTAEATHKGPFLGIEPTGKKVKFSGIVMHRIENGKFAESWNEIDLLGIQQQLTAQ